MISGVEYVSSQLLHRRAHLRYFSRRPQKQRCFRNGDRVPGETRSRRKPISPSRISAHCARCPPCPDRICVSLQSLPLLLLLGSPSTRCIRVAFRCSECETAGEKLARVVIENIATVACVCAISSSLCGGANSCEVRAGVAPIRCTAVAHELCCRVGNLNS